MSGGSEPRATRPFMPGYGVKESEEGALPWEWARERLAANRNYFVATVRADGRPHVMPVWGLWLDDSFLFSTGGSSQKAKNLRVNPNCAVTTERADEAVIVEGVFEMEEDAGVKQRFVEAYKDEYDWQVDADTEVFAVRPRKVFAFIEAAEDFAESATRWVFEDQPRA